MTPTERERWFKHYTPEQFAAWVDEQTRQGIPAKCEDPATLARIAQMMIDELRRPTPASRPDDLDDDQAEAA
jgi:hypothetical protein